MEILIEVKNSEANFIIELLKKLDFVEIKSIGKSSFLESLERGLKEMQEIRVGNLSKPDIAELFR